MKKEHYCSLAVSSRRESYEKMKMKMERNRKIGFVLISMIWYLVKG